MTTLIWLLFLIIWSSLLGWCWFIRSIISCGLSWCEPSHFETWLWRDFLASRSNLLFFFPGPSCLAIIASSFALATLRIKSTTPESRMPFRNLSESSNLLPKSWCFVLRVSLVCESKAGFSISALTKIHRFCLMWWALMFSFLFFFSSAALIFWTI